VSLLRCQPEPRKGHPALIGWNADLTDDNDLSQGVPPHDTRVRTAAPGLLTQGSPSQVHDRLASIDRAARLMRERRVSGFARACFVLQLSPMRLACSVVLLTVSCSASSTPSSSSTPPHVDSTQLVDAGDGGACHYPASVDVNASPSTPGCFGHPAGEICQVSNGANVNADDGGVTDGTESCQSLCGASGYEMTCMDTNAEPAPSLGCKIIPIPTPSCCQNYCCPCMD
jgi:hypothetical protein